MTMTGLTAAEKDYLERTLKSLESLKHFLCTEFCSPDTSSPWEFYSYLAKAKRILGNLNLGMSFAGNLMAKHYLTIKLPMIAFDAAQKPQGAPGLDIDVRTVDGQRVVAEVKTTDPYLIQDSGFGRSSENRIQERLRKAEKCSSGTQILLRD
jgi:hypothetical protein